MKEVTFIKIDFLRPAHDRLLPGGQGRAKRLPFPAGSAMAAVTVKGSMPGAASSSLARRDFDAGWWSIGGPSTKTGGHASKSYLIYELENL